MATAEENRPQLKATSAQGAATVEENRLQVKAAPVQVPPAVQPNPEAKCCSDFSSDVAKALIGSFAGAGAAFGLNFLAQRRIEKRDNLAAGRLALLTIRAQLDDFTNYRHIIRHSAAHLYAQQGPATPEWALAKPVGFDFVESNTFKLESLAFLLSTGAGRKAFERLQFVERTYFDLSSRHNDYHVSVQELQRAMAPLHAQHANLTYGELEAHFGPELLARVIDQQRAVVIRIDRDEKRYTAAFKLLNDAMVERYGEKVRMKAFVTPDHFKMENLPPLPPLLRAYVDSVPAAADD